MTSESSARKHDFHSHCQVDAADDRDTLMFGDFEMAQSFYMNSSTSAGSPADMSVRCLQLVSQVHAHYTDLLARKDRQIDLPRPNVYATFAFAADGTELNIERRMHDYLLKHSHLYHATVQLAGEQKCPKFDVPSDAGHRISVAEFHVFLDYLKALVDGAKPSSLIGTKNVRAVTKVAFWLDMPATLSSCDEWCAQHTVPSLPGSKSSAQSDLKQCWESLLFAQTYHLELARTVRLRQLGQAVVRSGVDAVFDESVLSKECVRDLGPGITKQLVSCAVNAVKSDCRKKAQRVHDAIEQTWVSAARTVGMKKLKDEFKLEDD